MNKDVQLFYDYIQAFYKIQYDADQIIDLTFNIVDDIKKNGNVIEVDDSFFNRELAKRIGSNVYCADYGIKDVKNTFSACTKKTVFGRYKVDFRLIKEELAKKVRDHAADEVRKEFRKLQDASVAIPKYILTFAKEIKYSGEKELFEEFEDKLKLCEDIKSVVSLVDDMKKLLLLKQLSDRVDEISSSIDDLESRISSLECQVRTLD